MLRLSPIILALIASCANAPSGRLAGNAASSGFVQGQICEDLTAMIDSNIHEPDLRKELKYSELYFQDHVACQRNIADRHPFSLSALEIYMLSYYSGDEFYNLLNKSLWKMNCAQYANASRVLASAINKIPARRGTVYRGLQMSPGELREQFKAGSVYQSPTFMSTSLDPDTALIFAKNTIFEIRNGAGGYLADHGSYENEMEVLLVPGTRFTVDSIESAWQGSRSFQLVKMTQTTRPLNSIVTDVAPMPPPWTPVAGSWVLLQAL